MTDPLNPLPRHLFWDTDPSQLDMQVHKTYIIGRVACMGTMAQWKALIGFYGIETIRQEAVRVRDMDPKTANFLSITFEIPLKEFACSSLKPSQIKPGKF